MDRQQKAVENIKSQPRSRKYQ